MWSSWGESFPFPITAAAWARASGRWPSRTATCRHHRRRRARCAGGGSPTLRAQRTGPRSRPRPGCRRQVEPGDHRLDVADSRHSPQRLRRGFRHCRRPTDTAGMERSHASAASRLSAGRYPLFVPAPCRQRPPGHDLILMFSNDPRHDRPTIRDHGARILGGRFGSSRSSGWVTAPTTAAPRGAQVRPTVAVGSPTWLQCSQPRVDRTDDRLCDSVLLLRSRSHRAGSVSTPSDGAGLARFADHLVRIPGG